MNEAFIMKSEVRIFLNIPDDSSSTGVEITCPVPPLSKYLINKHLYIIHLTDLKILKSMTGGEQSFHEL